MSVRKIGLFLLGLSCLAALIYHLGYDQVQTTLTALSLQQFVILCLLQTGTLLAGAWLWHFLVSQKVRISFWQIFLINQAASLVESLTPSVKLGGEAAKVFLLRQRTRQDYSSLTGILLLHKLLTLGPFLFLSLLIFWPALHMLQLPPVFYLSLPVLVFALIVLIIFCFPQAQTGQNPQTASNQPDFQDNLKSMALLIGKIRLFLSAARRTAAGLLTPAQTLGLLSLSLLIWLFYPLKVYLVCVFLGLETGFVLIALATISAYLISMLPLLPGGLGTYEGTMTLALTLGGLSPAEGLSISLLSQAMTFWFPLLLAAGASLILAWEGLAFKKTDPHFTRDPCP